jgi:DNA-directed RNA polymerase subunit RPC12/RpoP
MWQWLTGFRCGRCGELRGTGERALHSPTRSAVAVCETCLGSWERTGHRCARCWAPIRDGVELGLLVETGAFAHVGCGGARVLRSSLSGAFESSGAARRVASGLRVRLL